VILPCDRWVNMSATWRQAEAMGFHAAYTYDHLTWGRMQSDAWFGAVPTLAAAAGVTSEIRLGTMVTTPNFRHPVPLAKELLSLDDLSRGRLVIGVGAGGQGPDASVLGDEPWTARERSERFGDFLELLDQLLRRTETDHDGLYYRARRARMAPGPLVGPRPPIYVAANGPRGMDLAARLGDGWVTLGLSGDRSRDPVAVVRQQVGELAAALARHHVDDTRFARVVLLGIADVDAFDTPGTLTSLMEQFGTMGVTELVVHWPTPGTPFEGSARIFESSVAAALRSGVTSAG
jgi:alkanesulfonate monooxygenase SsuD/methylene tetrahydromethanopterin reductase-like flavin-dependent oxidoreductase (luciferase family)